MVRRAAQTDEAGFIQRVMDGKIGFEKQAGGM